MVRTCLKISAIKALLLSANVVGMENEVLPEDNAVLHRTVGQTNTVAVVIPTSPPSHNRSTTPFLLPVGFQFSPIRCFSSNQTPTFPPSREQLAAGLIQGIRLTQAMNASMRHFKQTRA